MKQKPFIVVVLIILILVLGALFIFTYKKDFITPRASSATATMALSPSSGSYQLNSTFDVAIQVNTGSLLTDAASANLQYNTTYLEVIDKDANKTGVQIAKGSMYPTELNNTVNTSSGQIIFEGGLDTSGTTANPVSGSGTLATITFKAKQTVTTTAVTFNFTAGSTSINSSGIAEHDTFVNVLGSVGNASYTIVNQSSYTVNLTLQGRTNSAASNITFEIYNVGGTNPIASKTDVSTDNAGKANFTLNNINAGNYDVRIRVPYFLGTKKANIALSTSNTIDFAQQLTGDIDNNNQVNSYDYSAMVTSWRLSTGNTNYNAHADLQQNGEVNIYDYSLLIANWRKQGA